MDGPVEYSPTSPADPSEEDAPARCFEVMGELALDHSETESASAICSGASATPPPASSGEESVLSIVTPLPDCYEGLPTPASSDVEAEGGARATGGACGECR